MLDESGCIPLDSTVGPTFMIHCITQGPTIIEKDIQFTQDQILTMIIFIGRILIDIKHIFHVYIITFVS